MPRHLISASNVANGANSSSAQWAPREQAVQEEPDLFQLKYGIIIIITKLGGFFRALIIWDR